MHKEIAQFQQRINDAIELKHVIRNITKQYKNEGTFRRIELELEGKCKEVLEAVLNHKRTIKNCIRHVMANSGRDRKSVV